MISDTVLFHSGQTRPFDTFTVFKAGSGTVASFFKRCLSIAFLGLKQLNNLGTEYLLYMANIINLAIVGISQSITYAL